MNGLEIAKGYFEEFGKPMLKSEFADILPFLAAGFAGSGSQEIFWLWRSPDNIILCTA